MEKAKPKKVLFDDIGTNWINGEPIFGCLCPSCELVLFQFTTDDLNDDIDTDEFVTYCLAPAYQMREDILKQLRILDDEYLDKDMPSISVNGVNYFY